MGSAQVSLAEAGAPSRARVMVADDSIVVRGLISRWLEEAGFEVVASVSNGRLAVEALGRVDPEIAILDIDMPELDGLSALPLLLTRKPGLAVVVVSTLTKRNAELSLQCLSLGAVDCLPKPESHRGLVTSLDFRDSLVARVRALGLCRLADRSPGRSSAPSPGLSAPTPLAVAPRCLLVGASTGGPKAVSAVLSRLVPTLQRLPVLVVQHMPPVFTAAFAEHLSAQTGLVAREAEAGDALVPGRVLVAPGGRHMGLALRGGQPVIRLDDGPPVNSCRPAVDVLFGDAASVLGASALALVLTGMGSDGREGARALVGAGAAVIVQDEATSTVWGMPGSVAKAGLARDVLPLDDIAPALKFYVTGSPP